jgi:hypothetical protein
VAARRVAGRPAHRVRVLLRRAGRRQSSMRFRSLFHHITRRHNKQRLSRRLHRLWERRVSFVWVKKRPAGIFLVSRFPIRA